MDQVNEKLTRQLGVEIEKLAIMEDGSDEKTATVEGITQMYKLKIEEARLDEEIKAREADAQRQERHKIIDTVLDGVRTAATVVGGIVIPVIFMNRGFKFEETGTYTSQTFRSLFGKFKLK